MNLIPDDAEPDTEGHVSSDSLDEAKLREALEGAIAIILGEYPAGDERYQFAMDAARRFNIDTEEM